MSRIDQIFTDLRSQRLAALLPFVTAGYPSLDATAAVIPAIEKAGSHIIEIGFPFSDPIADGPVIAASMHEALKRGVTPGAIFDMVRGIRAPTALGVVAMVSMSIVHRLSPEVFIEQAASAGFDGLIIPDSDLAEAAALSIMAHQSGLAFIPLISPTTSPQRLKSIVSIASGFLYVLARVGITGESATAPATAIARRIAEIRTISDLPVAVGFGISKPEHVAAVVEVADGAIVGSALVRRMGESPDPVQAAADFVAHLAAGLRRPAPAN